MRPCLRVFCGEVRRPLGPLRLTQSGPRFGLCRVPGRLGYNVPIDSPIGAPLCIGLAFLGGIPIGSDMALHGQ